MAKCFTIINNTKLFTDVLKAYAKDEYNREFFVGYNQESAPENPEDSHFYIIVRGIAMFYIHYKNMLLDWKAFPHLNAVERRDEKRGAELHFMNTEPIIKDARKGAPCEWTDSFETVNKKVYRVFKAADGKRVLIEKAMTDYIAQPDLLSYTVAQNDAIVGTDNCGDIEFYGLPLRKE